MTAATRWARIRSWLPTGDPLPETTWSTRNRAILTILWMHVPALLVVGVSTGHDLSHSLLEVSVVGLLAAGASLRSLGRTRRAVLTTLGLVGSSGILVHFSEGLIEMHFHFFVMVAVVTLYQAWMPFLVAIAFVVLHHGTFGVLAASSVYNHEAAIANPWRWAFVHGLFIAGASAAGLTAWKLNEIGTRGEREAREALERSNSELAEAQAMAQIGSWDWNVADGRVWWSDELYRITGQDPAGFVPSLDGFFSLVHPGDVDRVRRHVEHSVGTGEGFSYEARLSRPDGSYRTCLCLGIAETDGAGNPIRMSGTVQDITDRKTLEDTVEHQAFHDTLTDLANRALFLDRAEHALGRQQRTGLAEAVIFFDLDDFKSVNDSLGHAAGDELLKEVARRLGTLVRPSDTLARFGGDEFAILLEDLPNIEPALAVAERTVYLLQQPFRIGEAELFIGGSVGISVSWPRESLSAEELLRQADTAMYVAKRRGKNCIELFESAMHEEASARLALRADLQRAIDNGEFALHYQPIIEMDSGAVSGVEALIRWHHPERGLVPPLDFIPFAEETGLILPIGNWVLNEACRTAASWETADGTDPLSIAVNVSAVRFRHPAFVEELTGILSDTGLDPSRLTLELTESLLVQGVHQVADRLAELKELGVRLAIDDFGTGYSSLSYLRDLPIDVLKIDKTFIDSVALGIEDSALARAIIKLGHTLGLKVVAEGVEDGGQASILAMLECEYAQGYLFARPLTEEKLYQFLKEQAEKPPAGPPTLHPGNSDTRRVE